MLSISLEAIHHRWFPVLESYHLLSSFVRDCWDSLTPGVPINATVVAAWSLVAWLYPCPVNFLHHLHNSHIPELPSTSPKHSLQEIRRSSSSAWRQSAVAFSTGCWRHFCKESLGTVGDVAGNGVPFGRPSVVSTPLQCFLLFWIMAMYGIYYCIYFVQYLTWHPYTAHSELWTQLNLSWINQF